MTIHEQVVTDDWKYIRVTTDDEDNLVRVFIHEDWFQYFKPLYEYADLIAAGVSAEEVPNQIEHCCEWLSSLTIEISTYGWLFAFSIVGWVVHLAKNKISIGGFKYEKVGFGELYGVAPFGGGTRILELPVEG